MAAEAGTTTLAGVIAGGQEPEGRGARIEARRLAIGMGVAPFARAAHMDRGTVERAESDAPGTRETTYVALERTLDELEAEMGMSDPDAERPGVVRFVVRGVYGAESLVVEGPVDSIAELEKSVDRIMRRLAGNENGSTD